MKVSVSLLCSVGFLFVPYAVLSAESPPTKLEDIPAAIEQLNKDLVAKLDSVAKVVDTEAAAGRLAEPAAQTLRWTLQTAVSATGRLQLRTLISSSRLPTDNVAVMTALTELEAKNAEAQTRRTQLTGDATREIQARLAALLKTATKPEECAAFEVTLTALRLALQNESGYSAQSATISAAISVAQRLSRLIIVEATGETEQISSALQNLQSVTSYNSSSLNLGNEIDDRVQRLTKPLNAAIATAQSALDEALIAGKPLPEIDAALARFSQAAQGYVAPGAGGHGGARRDLRQDVNSYERVVDALRAAQNGNEAPEILTTFILQARGGLSALHHSGAEKLRGVLDGLEKKAAERGEKETAERMASVQRQLAAAKKPADLDAIAAEVAAWGREPRPRRGQDGPELWSPLSAEIGGLAAMWVSPVGAWPEDRLRGNLAYPPALTTTLRDLRRQIEREALSRQLRAPEILAAPLDALEADAALEALADQLVAKEEWRRLLTLSEARMYTQSSRGRPAQDESVAALRSFFAAQNLELAEQWTEAAQAYREVLRSPSARAPTVPAAEKLKALVKAHPEAGGQGSGAPVPRRTPIRER